MTTMTDEEAQRDFDQLLDRVERGEIIAITRRGKVIAWLAPWAHGEQRQTNAPAGEGL
jgi:prevent-host-death family protein